MKKFLQIAAIISAMSSCGIFAKTQYAGFPISIANSEAPAIRTNACVAVALPEDADALIEAAKTALKADPSSLKLSKAEAKRARAYKKMASPDAGKILAVAKLGEFYAVFPAAKKPLPKGRPNFNFMVFKKDGAKYQWLPSFNDPILQLMADGANSSAKFEAPKTAAFSESDAKIVGELKNNSLPFLNFENGAFVSLDAVADVDSTEVAKFYRKAQDIFYAWKIDEYGEFLTPRTKAAFESQFGAMSEQERKKTLGDYFAWGKKYLKALDAKPVYMMVFLRTKDGSPSRPDFAYILKDAADFKIAVFTDSKTPLEAFIGKYIFADGSYAENIAKKFAPSVK